MTDAKTLLLELLAVIPNGDKIAPLFAEDGVVELPFRRREGMEAQPRHLPRRAARFCRHWVSPREVPTTTSWRRSSHVSPHATRLDNLVLSCNHIRTMRRRFKDQNCSIAQALEVLGDWWTLLVVREAFVGSRRFADFEVNLDISKNILS